MLMYFAQVSKIKIKTQCFMFLHMFSPDTQNDLGLIFSLYHVSGIVDVLCYLGLQAG